MGFFGIGSLTTLHRIGRRNLFDSVRKNESKETLFGLEKKYDLFFIKKTQFLENIYVEAKKKKKVKKKYSNSIQTCFSKKKNSNWRKILGRRKRIHM